MEDEDEGLGPFVIEFTDRKIGAINSLLSSQHTTYSESYTRQEDFQQTIDISASIQLSYSYVMDG